MFISEEKDCLSESVEDESVEMKEIINSNNPNNPKKARPLYLCEHCEFTNSDRKVTDEHITQHKNNSHYKCKTCNLVFVTYLFLEDHIKKVHRKLPYVCGECDFKCKDFGNNRLMWFHMRARHVTIISEKQRPLVCKICGFQNKSNEMWRHMEASHLKTSYQCQICKCYFASQNKVRTHIQEKHVTKFIPILPKKGKPSRIEGRYVPIGPPATLTPKNVTLKSPFTTGELVFPSTDSVQVRYQPYLKARVCFVCGIAYTKQNTLCQHIQQMKRENLQKSEN